MDRVDEARVQLRDFCGIDLYLGAVGLLQDQLILYEVANELHEQRVGRLLDLVEDAGLRRQSLQPADEPRGSELSGGRSREHGIVAAIGVRVVAKGAHRRDRAFLDLDFPALLELREIGTLGDGDSLSLRVKQQLSFHLVIRGPADDMVAVLGLDDRGDLPGLESEQRTFEFWNHRTTREKPQRSARFGRCLVLAIPARQLGEVGRGHLAAEGVDALLDVRFLGIALVLSQQQDVIGAQYLTIFPLPLRGGGVFHTPALGDDLVPLASLEVGDRRPHRLVDQLRIAERVVMRSGISE